MPVKRKKRFTRPTMIQSVVLDRTKSEFDTLKEVREFAKRNNLKATKIDKTKNRFRLRQVNPDKFKRGTFRNIRLRKNVTAVIGVPKMF